MAVERPGTAGRATRRLGRTVVLTALVVLTAPAGALAATRYAEATGGASAGTCPQATACTLAYAVSGASAGDTIIVEPGTYASVANIEPSVDNLTIEGEPGQAFPTLDAALGGPIFSSGIHPLNLSHLDLVGSNDEALDVVEGGTLDHLMLTGEAGSGNDVCTCANGVLVDSQVIANSSSNGAAVGYYVNGGPRARASTTTRSSASRRARRRSGFTRRTAARAPATAPRRTSPR